MTLGWKASELEEGKQPHMAAALGLSKYVCPVCGAHVKQNDKDKDEYMCLNMCHRGKSEAEPTRR